MLKNRLGVVQNKKTFPDHFSFLQQTITGGFSWAEFKYGTELDRGGVLLGGEGKRLGRMAKESEIAVSVHMPSNPRINLGDPSEEIRRETHERINACLEFAACVQAQYVSFHTGFIEVGPDLSAAKTSQRYSRPYPLLRETIPHEDFEAFERRVLNELMIIAKQAAARGIRVALENSHGFSNSKLNFPVIPADFRDCQAALGEDFCVVYDSGHAHSTGWGILEFITEIGPENIVGTHLHDNDGTRDQHLPLGSGTVDFPAFFKKYLREGWSFPLNLELKTLQDFTDSRSYISKLLHEIPDDPDG